MNYNNLSKLFRYVNENGDSIVFDYSGGYLINKPTGIDTVSVQMNEAQGIDQVGSAIKSINVQSRPVKISGVLVGEFQAEDKDRLLSVIRPDLSGKLYADDFYLNVRPSATPAIEQKPTFASFQFSLLAPYPYWQRDDSASATLSGVSKNFKFPWNISKPYKFGTVMSAQFININNMGQVPIPYTVTFTALAGVTNPKIIDASTNKFLLINKELVAGERLVIEITHERTFVTSSVDGECRGALDLKSSFFRLKVGDNVLKPDADEGKQNLQVDVSYAIEVVGIAL